MKTNTHRPLATLLFGITFSAGALLAGADAAEQSPPAFETTEAREPCAHYDPLRQPFFGDTHVHTRYSQDASTQGTTTTPDEAYAFARGEPLTLAKGVEGALLRLDRPLDFAVVTDHAEQLGEVEICSSDDLKGRASPACILYRAWPRAAFYVMNGKTSFLIEPDRWRFCGPDGERCLNAAMDPWEDIQAAAERAYDRTSACTLTTFVGYEWTGGHRTQNLHRNVIFRGAQVPERPISTYEAWTPQELWEGLTEACEEGMPGCEVLTIPHNSNLAGERMFSAMSESGDPLTFAEATQRAHYEPLLEIMQHKGASECVSSPLAPDEQCGFETLPYHAFMGRFIPFTAQGAIEAGTARYALGEGVRVHELIGANPFRYGMIGSTDTHLGAPGAVSEVGYPGHGGAGKPGSSDSPSLSDTIEYGPGGLAVVWAEENSRDAIFAAMQRREVYGTSGPRPIVRFFGGWQLPEDLCERNDAVESAYANGVPMGGILGQRPDTTSPPTFYVQATWDAGTANSPGTPLESIQIIKGWVEDGKVREAIIEVAQAPGAPGTVDLTTCTPSGDGAHSLCATWTDRDFDPSQGAYYYARVLEAPTCRWSAHQCLRQGVSCNGGDVPRGLKACCAPEHRWTQNERAWTSPIWYDGPTPAKGQP